MDTAGEESIGRNFVIGCRHSSYNRAYAYPNPSPERLACNPMTFVSGVLCPFAHAKTPAEMLKYCKSPAHTRDLALWSFTFLLAQSNPLFALYSKPPINLFLTFVLTTPPTPNAGTILQILATALIPQSLSTLPTLSPALTSGLLYKSRPSKCKGVLTNCTAAGVTNCAALALDIYFCTPSDMCCSKLGASRGGKLKDAKIVMQSRIVKRANVGRGTARLGPPVEPKSCVNLLSLYKHRLRLAVLVARNLVVPAVVEDAEVWLTVEAAVSMVLAVK
jgi:hypothetical protein